MSELIDRQALLDSVYKNLPMIPSMSGMTAEEMRLRIAVLIENAPTASPWHRVEEEMPDLLQFVVVCNDEGKCVVAQYVGYQTDSLTPWRIAYTMYDTDAYYEMENGPVRYWMPIEPPKEEEE